MSEKLISQNVLLHDYLRGHRNSLTVEEARDRFGIQNLRARMSELRDMGLIVHTEKTKTGANRYSISSRDAWGSRASYTK
ncbi:Helix-turn-helix domain protein [uncultured archaeon]|nr:Helix-turn-helix domain protein [uncultured archaeon]